MSPLATPHVPEVVTADPFDLKISAIENSDDGVTVMLNVTDNGCTPTCHGSCTTNIA